MSCADILRGRVTFQAEDANTLEGREGFQRRISIHFTTCLVCRRTRLD